MITVIGATGRIGDPLVRELLLRSSRVTAVSRTARRLDSLVSAGAVPAVIDLQQTDRLSEVLRGVSAVFIALPFLPRSEAYRKQSNALSISTALALQAAQPPAVINLSSLGAHLSSGTGIIKSFFDHELRMNTLTGPNVLHLRIPFLMDNLYGAIPVIRRFKALRAMIEPHLPIPMIAGSDLARIAADHLSRPGFQGIAVESVQGLPYTMTELARILGRAAGIDHLRYHPFTRDEYIGYLADSGFPRAVCMLLAEMQESINSGILYSSHQSETIREPHNPMSFHEFARRMAPFLFSLNTTTCARG